MGLVFRLFVLVLMLVLVLALVDVGIDMDMDTDMEEGVVVPVVDIGHSPPERWQEDIQTLGMAQESEQDILAVGMDVGLVAVVVS